MALWAPWALAGGVRRYRAGDSRRSGVLRSSWTANAERAGADGAIGAELRASADDAPVVAVDRVLGEVRPAAEARALVVVQPHALECSTPGRRGLGRSVQVPENFAQVLPAGGCVHGAVVAALRDGRGSRIRTGDLRLMRPAGTTEIPYPAMVPGAVFTRPAGPKPPPGVRAQPLLLQSTRRGSGIDEHRSPEPACRSSGPGGYPGCRSLPGFRLHCEMSVPRKTRGGQKMMVRALR